MPYTSPAVPGYVDKQGPVVSAAEMNWLDQRAREMVSVRDFGAVGDGATDDTAAIQAAITYAAQLYQSDWFASASYTQPRTVYFPSSIYKVAGTLLVPRGLILLGGNSTLIGTGYGGGDNVCFETAYFNSGVLTSNIGTPPETQRVQFTQISGFKLINFRIGFNFYNFNEGCRLADVAFYDCGQNLSASRCFYSQFSNLASRGSAGGTSAAAFLMDGFVNVEEFKSIFCIDRVLAFSFVGGVSGVAICEISCESGTDGIVFVGEVNAVNLDSCYFESLTGTAIDLSYPNAHQAVTINNSFFNIVGTGIKGVQMKGGLIGAGNYFLATTTIVDISDATSTITLEMQPLRIDSLLPSFPSGYVLGEGVNVVYPLQTYDISGVTKAKQNYSQGLIPLPFSGQQATYNHSLPFCTYTPAFGTPAPYDVTITTRIVYDDYVPYIYSIVVVDGGGSSFTFNGRGFGANVYADATPAGKTVAASSVGGFLVFTLGGFAASTFAYAEGFIRMP